MQCPRCGSPVEQRPGADPGRVADLQLRCPACGWGAQRTSGIAPAPVRGWGAIAPAGWFLLLPILWPLTLLILIGPIWLLNFGDPGLIAPDNLRIINLIYAPLALGYVGLCALAPPEFESDGSLADLFRQNTIFNYQEDRSLSFLFGLFSYLLVLPGGIVVYTLRSSFLR